MELTLSEQISGLKHELEGRNNMILVCQEEVSRLEQRNKELIKEKNDLKDRCNMWYNRIKQIKKLI